MIGNGQAEDLLYIGGSAEHSIGYLSCGFQLCMLSLIVIPMCECTGGAWASKVDDQLQLVQ